MKSFLKALTLTGLSSSAAADPLKTVMITHHNSGKKAIESDGLISLQVTDIYDLETQLKPHNGDFDTVLTQTRIIPFTEVIHVVNHDNK